jgi:hypothetical protein
MGFENTMRSERDKDIGDKDEVGVREESSDPNVKLAATGEMHWHGRNFRH